VNLFSRLTLILQNQYRAELQSLEDDQQHLLEILQRTQEQLAMEEPQIRQLTQETQQLELEVYALQKDQQKLTQETQNGKQQSKQLEEQIVCVIPSLCNNLHYFAVERTVHGDERETRRTKDPLSDHPVAREIQEGE